VDIKSIFMGLAFVLMWSSAFTSARIIVQSAPPMMALSLRFFLSGLIAVSLAVALGQRLRLNRSQWRATLIFGVCQNALYLGLFFIAMQNVGAGLAAIVASTMPLLVALFSRLFLGETIRPMGIGGLIVGFIGVAIIMGSRTSTELDQIGLLLMVIGVLALTLATLVVRSATSGGNVLMVMGLQMLIGSAVLVFPAVYFETIFVVWSPGLIAAFAYTLLVPGLLATWVWMHLVSRIGSTRAATYHFLNPFFGVAIAALLLGERLVLRDFIGVSIIAAGILAVQLSRRV